MLIINQGHFVVKLFQQDLLLNSTLLLLRMLLMVMFTLYKYAGYLLPFILKPEVDWEILDGSPIFASHRSAHLFGLFLVSGRLSSGIEVLNEEEYSILRILYCYSLQQHIFLAFCNDFDTHYRVLAYILLRNTTLLFPKWRQKPTRPILRYSSVVNMEMCKIINFENS